MAMRVEQPLVGVDVSKAELVIAREGEANVVAIANTPAAIDAWLAALDKPVALAVEATGIYHMELAEAAHAAGHQVYLLDGLRLARYREAVGARAKTDTCDARLALRYLASERAHLRLWTPPPAAYTRIHALLRRRVELVESRVALVQSFADLEGFDGKVAALRKAAKQLEVAVTREIIINIRKAGWAAHAERCQGLTGVGPLTAAALAMTFHRGHFRSSDAFIAFLGLDVRVRDSGTHRGRRRLTKKGNPELRRLLYLAAMQAVRRPEWAAYYQRLLDRGLARTAALVAVARKLARVAFALMSNETQYTPERVGSPCQAT